MNPMFVVFMALALVFHTTQLTIGKKGDYTFSAIGFGFNLLQLLSMTI